jgi:hypothetical protein
LKDPISAFVEPLHCKEQQSAFLAWSSLNGGIYLSMIRSGREVGAEREYVDSLRLG